MSNWYDRDRLFEALNDRIDKPIDYNHLISMLVDDIYAVLAALESSIFYVDGVPYRIDDTRGKALSLGRNFLEASAYGQTVTDRGLKIGEVPSQGDQGRTMLRDGTITGITAKSRSTSTWTVEVRKNGIPVTIVSSTVTSGIAFQDNINIDFSEGDYLQVFANGTNIKHPIVNVEFAWRTTPPP